jgi:hypothetical protein
MQTLRYNFTLIIFLRSALGYMQKKHERSPDICEYFSDTAVRRVV